MSDEVQSIATATSVVPSPYKTLALAYFLAMQGDWRLAAQELERWTRSPTDTDQTTPGYCGPDAGDLEERICDWYELTVNAHIAGLANEFVTPAKVAAIYKRNLEFFERNLAKHLQITVSQEVIDCSTIKKRSKTGPIIVEILWNGYIQDSNSFSFNVARAGLDWGFADAKRLSRRNAHLDFSCFLQPPGDELVDRKELRDRIDYFSASFGDTFAFVTYRTAQYYGGKNLVDTDTTRDAFLEARKILRDAHRTVISQVDALKKSQGRVKLSRLEDDVLVLHEKYIQKHLNELERLIRALDYAASPSRTP